MAIRAAFVALAVWTACADPGAVAKLPDAGDAGGVLPGDDAAPACGTTWHLVDIPATAVRLIDPARPNTARTIRFVVEAELGGCDVVAPARVDYEKSGASARIQMRVWRPGGDCAAPARTASRPVGLELDRTATWTVEAHGTSDRVEIEVFAAPQRACGQGGGCEMDCDCPDGQRCLGGAGLGGPFLQCATPCELDLDCAAGVCASLDDGLAFSCEQNTPQCGAGLSCGRGYSCEDGVCEPAFQLGAHTRTKCGCDADCGDGLRCVDPQVPGEPRRCEVVCTTGSSGWCSAGHVCGGPGDDAAGLAAAEPVCVQVGD